MKRRLLLQLEGQLSERDRDILSSLEHFRLLESGQIQRLHFAAHATPLAAARACNRALRRLAGLRLINSLERRIGGVRRGSASYVWQLGPLGERYFREIRGHAHRRRYLEPGAQFVHHTLAVNEIAVALLEADHGVPGFRVERLTTEPGNWRRYLGPAGEIKWLKPDLHVVTALSTPNDGGTYEEHAYIEVDLGTEHLPRIQAKCQTYIAFARTGAYQAAHGLFPVVFWVSPDKGRRAALRGAVAGTPDLPEGLFTVASPGDYIHAATRGHLSTQDGIR